MQRTLGPRAEALRDGIVPVKSAMKAWADGMGATRCVLVNSSSPGRIGTDQIGSDRIGTDQIGSDHVGLVQNLKVQVYRRNKDG